MKKAVFLATFAALSPALVVPAHAVVLEQKWTPDVRLSYGAALTGTMNLRAPANANFILAGVPLEVEIRGDGTTQLQVLSVDESGVGTLVFSVPQFDLQAQGLGQKGQMILQNNTSRFLLNGKAQKLGDGTNPLNNSQTALRISRQGRFLGVQSLKPPTATAPVTAPPTDGNPGNPASAINQSALVMASLVRALPTLWPGRDVQVGEAWKSEISVPAPSKTDAKKYVPTPLGTYNWTLKGTEAVGGKFLQRVGVIGKLNVDSTQFRPADAKSARGTVQQDVTGDVWLDAAAGQIERADLVLGARFEGGQNERSQGFADFTGRLQINLKNAP